MPKRSYREYVVPNRWTKTSMAMAVLRRKGVPTELRNIIAQYMATQSGYRRYYNRKRYRRHAGWK